MSDFPYLPDGYHGVTPSLTVKDASAALAFYAKAFGAVELMRLPSPDGAKVMHAEFRIANSTMMISDEYPEMGFAASEIGQGGCFMLYVADAEAVFAQAVEAGAEAAMPVTDMFWGDRMGRVNDPYGYRWSIAQRVREVSEEELKQGAEAWSSGAG